MRFYIKEAREKAGLTQKELAKILGVAPNTYNGYETGKHDPKSELLAIIARACSVTVDFLLGLEPAPQQTAAPEKQKSAPSVSDEALDVAKKYAAASEDVRAAVRAVLAIVKTVKPLEPNFVAKKPTRVVPLFGASYAAGSPEVPGDLTPADYETTEMRADFAVHVNGNSMEPYLPDGSIALGMKRAPEDGEVGAFYLDGGFLVKQVCQDSQGNVYLFSLNRERSDADDIIWHDSGRELMVMGTIIMDKRIPLP